MRAIDRLSAAVLGTAAVAGLVGTAAPALATGVTTSAKAAVPGTFAFAGGGWGHGIGMSQVGAFGMASEGASATKILTHYYTGTTVGPHRDDQPIAVNLAHRASVVQVRTEALAAGGGGISMKVGTKAVTGKAGDVFRFTVSGTHVAVAKNGVKQGTATTVTVRWSGTRYPSATSGDDTKATLLDLVDGSGSFPYGAERYRYGYARVVARAQSGVTRLEAVNVLRLGDEYLRGLGEVPSSWPAAALQAQVIAARSFALVKYDAGLRASCQCHVDNGVSDQVFVGYEKEASYDGGRWASAVTATRPSPTTGRTVLYAGAPAEAFYSASTGGRTQNDRDVWGGDLPYLVSVDDHWSTEPKYNPGYASWGPENRSQAQVANVFGLHDVVRIDLSKRYVSGALSKATAWSSAGKHATISVASFVGGLGLTSNWVRRADAGFADGTTTGVAVAVGRVVAPSSRTVVIASSSSADTIDALVAAPLAHAKKAPILLAPSSGLTAAVTADLRRRHATKAYLVGGTGALGPGVVSDLHALGVGVTRVGGASHYATSVAVARALHVAKGTPAFVVSASDPSSALVAAAPAARLRRPLLLVSSRSGVTSSVASYLPTLAPSSVTVVGASAAVSDATVTALHARRLAGSSVPGTSATVARNYGPWLSTTRVVVAAGSQVDRVRTLPTLGAAVLLTGASLDSSTRLWLQTHPHVSRVTAVGGALPASTVTAARLA